MVKRSLCVVSECQSILLYFVGPQTHLWHTNLYTIYRKVFFLSLKKNKPKNRKTIYILNVKNISVKVCVYIYYSKEHTEKLTNFICCEQKLYHVCSINVHGAACVLLWIRVSLLMLQSPDRTAKAIWFSIGSQAPKTSNRQFTWKLC